MEGPGGFDVVRPPESGLWRVARGPDPLKFSDPVSPDELDIDNPTAGNRFDCPVGSYSVLYAGSQLECCFIETLARFRADAQLPKEVTDEFEKRGFMTLGDVPADWRARRLKVQFAVDTDRLFVDVDHANTIKVLRARYGRIFQGLGIEDLDRSDVLGKDRRVTRWISYVVFNYADEGELPALSGIRYGSRLHGSYDAWAIFEGTEIRALRQDPIDSQDRALLAAAKKLGVVVH